MNKGRANSFNEWASGMYRIASDTDLTDIPTGAYSYGILVVFVTESFSMQVYASHRSECYFRVRFDNSINNWSKVQSIILT